MRALLIPGAAAAVLVVIASPTVARADTYTEASFSGMINPGNANVQAPFSGNGFNQSDPFTGSIVFDNQLVPGGGTGLTNVFFQSFPDSAIIPPASSFSLTFDSLSFNLGNNINADLFGGIQYNNGSFNGVEFITDFPFQSKQYQFRIDGPVITVQLLDVSGNPTGPSLINATINSGGLTNARPFTPTPVPVPGGVWLLLSGLAGLGFLVRRGATKSPFLPHGAVA